MKLDREKALQAFASYVENYDSSDSKIALKIEHTYRVSSLCEQIAASLGWTEEETGLAWLIGLLHDIGRFEQLRRYGTFIDAQSIDHAGFGADILFREGRIRDYIEDASQDMVIETAVRRHSAYRIPEQPDSRTKAFCDILRDADKIDILKVNVDFPLEEIYNVTEEELRTAEISPEVMESFQERHATHRSLKKTVADHVAGHISLIFELVYPLSLQIVVSQGYLDRLLNFRSENEQTERQFAVLRETVEKYVAENYHLQEKMPVSVKNS